MIAFILIVAAGIFALAVLIGVALGILTPHLIPLAVLFLAIAMLLGGANPWGRKL